MRIRRPRNIKKPGKKKKKEILNHFCKTTGYHRKYAISLLSNWDKEEIIRIDNKCVRLKTGTKKRKSYSHREREYDDDFQEALIKIWEISDFMCGKRLRAYISRAKVFLQRNEEFQFNQTIWNKLNKVSPATIDRILKTERKKYQLKGKSLTKPGNLLKRSIPIKTFAEWNNAKPGFLEIDLVGHEGGNAIGDFCYTLTVTDVATGWTIVRGIRNKARKWTVEALDCIIKIFPFPVLGIDSDNGGEFINAHLKNYCERNTITFTRSRPYKKNDGCFVEQKNDIVVRRTAGYLRYDTDEELVILNEMYDFVCPLVNFFHPSVKLIEKIRTGGKVKKIYDSPKTPLERVLESNDVSENDKRKLRMQENKSDPVKLQRKVEKYKDILQDISTRKNQRELNL